MVFVFRPTGKMAKNFFRGTFTKNAQSLPFGRIKNIKVSSCQQHLHKYGRRQKTRGHLTISPNAPCQEENAKK